MLCAQVARELDAHRVVLMSWRQSSLDLGGVDPTPLVTVDAKFLHKVRGGFLWNKDSDDLDFFYFDTRLAASTLQRLAGLSRDTTSSSGPTSSSSDPTSSSSDPTARRPS